MKKVVVMIVILFLNINVYAKEVVKLDKCVDGDTAWFYYNNEVSKFRFLAIDTPESINKIEAYGKEASNYTCDRLTKAKKIEVEFDPNSNQKDKYDRYLAWIFVDGKLLQADIVEKGYAEVKYLYGDYKYTDELKALEKKAKGNRLGIYSDYENNDQQNNALYFLALIVIIILFIFSKSFRRKCLKQIKKDAIKKVKKSH